MTTNCVSLTRQELFDLVWKTPVSKLAKQFGVSDVALRKKCKKHGIPTPGVGYWARVAVGKAPKRPRLPAGHSDDEVMFDQSAFPRVEPPTVNIPNELSDPHAAVVWLQSSLKKAPPDHHGRLVIGHSYSPTACITKASAPLCQRT